MVAGGERTPMAITVGTGLAFAAMAWQFASIVALVTAFFILFVGPLTLRTLGKRDDKMIPVFMRYLRYRKYYPAQSTPHRKR